MVYQKNTLKIFSDLGKPTRRGVRRCYKCGTINGTRGYSCKNKQCDVVFKEDADKRVNLEAVKLTGTSSQLFSVRVTNKGPENRGFVQLSLLNLLSDSAICFVVSCQSLFDDSILRCHETDIMKTISSRSCSHVESALQSDIVATQINLKESTLNLIKIPAYVKNKLWELISAGNGSVVQRVSKHVMVVKCQVSAKHPLGYLHFTFAKSKGKDVFDKFVCSCAELKSQINEDAQQKCIHYYACVCSFASNSRLTEEFMNFINLEFEIGFTRMHFKNIRAQKIQSQMENEQDAVNPTKMRMKKLKQTGRNSQLDVLRNKYNRASKSKLLLSFKREETGLSYDNWFTSVVEMLNRSLDYNINNNNNITNSLVFFIPENFFESLRKKIHLIVPTNKLSKFTETYLRNNDPTNTIFCREIIHLNDIKYVSELFKTPQLCLETIRKYIQQNNMLCNQENQFTMGNLTSIIVNLQVRCSEDHQESRPFIIEWTPNIFKIAKFGELRLKFTVIQQIINSENTSSN